MSKILIVEDEVAIAELEKDYLELSGFDVVMQHTGDAGLKAALNVPLVCSIFPCHPSLRGRCRQPWCL